MVVHKAADTAEFNADGIRLEVLSDAFLDKVQQRCLARAFLSEKGNRAPRYQVMIGVGYLLKHLLDIFNLMC